MSTNIAVRSLGGRLVKWKGRVASIAPALASVSVIALMTTGAIGQTVIDSVVNTEQVISIDEDITVTADGRIRLHGGSDPAPLYIDVGNASADYSSVVTNDGEIDLLQSSGVSPAGIWLEGNLSGGSIINNGDITVDVMNGNSDASAAGIYVSGDVNGTITNSSTGLIDVLVASDSYNATAYGIQIDGNVGEMGVITNAGIINAEANSDVGFYNSSSSYAYPYASATGIYIGGDLDGKVNNSGTIDVRAASGTSSATAYGIYVSGTATGNITNSGDILVEAMSSTSTAAAYGIYVGSDMNSMIDNTGTIDVYAESDTSDASAYGIYVSGTVTGDITNSGDIIVEALTGTDSDASAYGIYVGALDGSITNSGLVDVYAHSVTSDASAYGVYASGDMNGTITNTENGVITVTASAPGSGAEAYGVYVSGDMNVDGSIVNDGRIEAFAETLDNSSASAWGIYVGGGLYGTIENSGDILASAMATSYSAYAYGIEIDGDLDGSITNTGTITATAYSTDYTAEAYGIRSYTLDGTITNTGTIAATAHSTDYTAEAYGIYIDGTLNGTITNTGTITTNAYSTDSDASAYGIYIAGPLNGAIDGNGTILATATSEYSDASAYGIYVSGAIGEVGLIDVSGLIEATAQSSSDSASAYGIYVYGDMDGTIAVSGTIAAQADNSSSDYDAYAVGIYIQQSDVGGNVDGTITVTSTGVIDVSAENYSSSDATATGIYVGGDVGGAIENHGLITVEAYGSSGHAEAYGISVDGTVDGSITNSGTIDVYAHTSNSYDSAYGIYAGAVGVGGIVTNSGQIEVYAGVTSSTDYAAGVYLGGMAGHFINTGSIVASEYGNIGTAIYVDGSGGLVTLNTGGFIEGNIELDGDISLNVQGDVGRSVNWTVDGSGATSGAYYTNDEGYLGTAVFVRENSENGAAEFATFDSSGLAAVRQAGADAGFIGLDGLLSQTSKAAAKPVHATNGTGNSFMPFVRSATKSVTYGHNETMLDQDITTSLLSFGGTTAIDSGLIFGLGAGMMSGSATVNYINGPSSETDQKGAFIGLAMGGSSANLNYSGAISSGRVQFDNTRYVNDNTVTGGIVAEDASFNSTFMAVEFAVSGRFDIGSGMALVPNTTLRYAKHKVDGYVESGTDGAAAVGPQNYGVFEGEIGIALEKAMGNGVFSGGISVMSRSVTGNEDVAITMIGDSEFVDATIGSSTAAKLSLGYSSSFSASGQFNVGVETLVGSSGMSGEKISGGVSFSF